MGHVGIISEIELGVWNRLYFSKAVKKSKYNQDRGSTLEN